jgi:hypothetical protein
MEFQLGRALVIFGVVLVAIGLLLMFGARVSFLHFGRLPGDIAYKGKNGSFYFPIVSCILISAALTLVLWLISLLMRK